MSRAKLSLSLLAGVCTVLLSGGATQAQSEAAPAFRPPAVPLVTSDPYLSIWSEADHLTDKNTQHWTHSEHALVSLIRIDGRAYRLMGDDPDTVPALPQTRLQVFPTRSIYDFGNAQVHVTLTFMTAALPHDLNVLSRPLSYITWQICSNDGKPHAVSIYDSTSSELAVNTPDQKVVWSRETMGPLTAMQVGSGAQTLLRPAGDDTRIDWGYAYAAAPEAGSKSAIAGDLELTTNFVLNGSLRGTDDSRQPRAVADDQPVLAFVFDLGKVGAAPLSRHMIVAYDELYSIRFAGARLRPYWRRNGTTPAMMLQAAERDYPALVQRCAQFDTGLMADLTAVGGARYAQIAALAYRECLAANGLAVDSHGQPLLFTKENTSNGDIATVDVIFPQSPMMILLSPTLAKASVVPVLDYASSPVWKFPNSPHDLGTYPDASATGNAGEEMTVEESGNMLIICDAITQEDGNARFVTAYWPVLSKWADYLAQYGLDPGDQLCTDDFMGHLAHNANLSIKAIVALAAYADMCRRRGDTAGAARYAKLAKDDAAHWEKTADAGDHSLLAFDKPGTWSQKYNLVWDQILGLGVFPISIREKETAYYKAQVQPYGVPLDSRTHLTKTDWSVWSATLATNETDFRRMVAPIYAYLDETSSRDPIADSYMTDDVRSGGMHARPVVGGLFVKMLADRAMWNKWSAGDAVKAADWAPMPTPPTVAEYLIPTSQTTPQTWRYLTRGPAPADWTAPQFDDSSWSQGQGVFGTFAPPPGKIGTSWTDTPGDLWLRRSVTLPPDTKGLLAFMCYHDEDVEIYVDGVPASSEAGYNSDYQPLDIDPAARALLTPGATVTIAVHCIQTVGGQGVDVGLAKITAP